MTGGPIRGVAHGVVVVVRGDCDTEDGYDGCSSYAGEVGGSVAAAQGGGAVGGVTSSAKVKTRSIVDGVLGCIPLEKDELLLLRRRCCRGHGWKPFRYAFLACFKLICIQRLER